MHPANGGRKPPPDPSPSGGSLVEELPTPIARSAIRAARAAGAEHIEKFNALQFIAEALIKYLTLTLHTAIGDLDASSKQFVGYLLARADGLGAWDEALDSLEQAIRRPGLAGDSRQLIDFLSLKRSGANATGWFDGIYADAESLWSQTADQQFAFTRSIRGILRFLIAFRNKTRAHGAFPRRYYEEVNPTFERLMGQLTQLKELFGPTLLWAEKVPDGIVCRALRGPAPTTLLGDLAPAEAGLWMVFPTAKRTLRFAPLFKYDPVTDACYFANGAWSEKTATAEGLDYFTGSVVRLDLSEFAGPVHGRNRSETAGAQYLIDARSAAHNLPRLFEGYIERGDLEQSLTHLLTDKTHRVLTLRGMGGVGKTSLALHVATRLVDADGCPFLWVLWFSARDVDLTTAGPKKKDPEVQDIEGIAETYCRLIANGETGRKALELFASEMSNSDEPTLLIMDNFETMSDQRAVQAYLDETVVLPSKVLITSRHQRFKGDYPIEVTGMSPVEAESLIRREAARLGCSNRLTPNVIKKICTATSNVPYAIKLVVGQLSRNLPVDQILDLALGQEGILEALFRRSVEMLSPNAHRMFLTVGNLSGAIPAVPLRAVMGASGIPFDGSLEECERSSLLQCVEEETSSFINTPEVARRFARTQLPGADDSLEMERDLELLRIALVESPSTSSAADFARQLEELITSESQRMEIRRSLIRVLEALATEFPKTWINVARLREKLGATPGEVRQAFQRATEYDRNDGNTWIRWASFEQRQQNERREVDLLIRAAECRPHDVKLNSFAAAKIAALINRDKRGYPLADRPILVAKVRQNLEAIFTALDADSLARLGWLHWLMNDRADAERCAQRGLQLDSRNQHCLNIRARVRASRPTRVSLDA